MIQKFLYKTYLLITCTFSIIILILSFFPIFCYYVISAALLLIFIELIRLKKLHNVIQWILKKEKKDWDVRNSFTLKISFYSLIISLVLFVCLWVIMEFFYILPLKKELHYLINK